MTHTTDNIALVEVPDNLPPELAPGLIADMVKKGMIPGDYRLIGLSTEMTEEKAAMIVKRVYPVPDAPGLNGYWNYMGDDQYEDSYSTALESFASLLTALGCDPAKVCAVLVKE